MQPLPSRIRRRSVTGQAGGCSRCKSGNRQRVRGRQLPTGCSDHPSGDDIDDRKNAESLT